MHLLELYGKGILQNAEWLSYAEWIIISREFLYYYISEFIISRELSPDFHFTCSI